MMIYCQKDLKKNKLLIKLRKYYKTKVIIFKFIVQYFFLFFFD